MTTYTWTGAKSFSWTDALNWSPSTGYPSSNDFVVIAGGTSGVTVTLPAAETISGLSISGAVTLSGTSSDKLTITSNGNVTLAAGSHLNLTVPVTSAGLTLSGTGTYTISGGSLSTTGTINIATGQDLVLTGGAELDIQSAFSGAGDLTLAGATFNGAAGGLAAVNLVFDTVNAGGTPNVVTTAWSGTQFTSIKNLGYGDSIKINGVSSLKLVSNGNGTYSLEKDQYNIYCKDVTLASGTDVNDFVVSDGYLVYTGTAACFMAGALLATPEGQIAVEEAVAGTVLLTADGRAVRVRWLGRSTVSTRFGDPLRVLPIRIQAGALGEALPARDLLVSPDHALLIDGALIQAGALVNGVNIVREHDVPERFAYYHVEMDTHEVLLAEGVPTESYLETFQTLRFDNLDERPEPPAGTELPYPRAQSARQVPAALRARLAARARQVGAVAA